MKQILVIEDNTDIRENICELLELSGYKILNAENGKEGAKLAIEHIPHLIVCDVMMPVLDGYGTLKILQKNPTTSHIPFIFLTAKADKGDFRKGMNLGADDYLTKPFDDVELLEAIEIRLKKQQDLPPIQEGNIFNIENHYQKKLHDFLLDKQSISYPPKSILYQERHHPKNVFFLKKGKAQTFKTTDWGKELVLTLYSEGEFIGLEDVYREGVYQEAARCIEAAKVILIPVKDFQDWIRQDSSISHYFIQLLAKQTGQKDQELLDLAYSTVRERVAAALLKLKEHYHQNDTGNFETTISREDLAHIVGTTKESVTRMLSELKKEKIITINGSEVTIIDSDKLEAIRN